jgi:exodeoxyribonuclease VII large subunit
LSNVITNIALITAPNSDGQRDFLQELKLNKHNYTFQVSEFLVTIQGETASQQILDQLLKIKNSKNTFDVIAIVRGGGSLTDFKPFDDYTLAQFVAAFPIPIITGIGHDRNQSIVDLMAREQKTPTKVASTIVDHNFLFENYLIDMKRTLFQRVQAQPDRATENLNNAKRTIKLTSPQAILNRGFAIIKQNDTIIVDPREISVGTDIQIILRDETLHSQVTKKTKNKKAYEL